jgi:hypothetical protein
VIASSNEQAVPDGSRKSSFLSAALTPLPTGGADGTGLPSE